LTGVGWFGGALEGEGTAGADDRNEKFEDASSINLRRCGWPAPFSHLSTLAMSSSTRRDRVDIDSRLPAEFASLLGPQASSVAALGIAGAVSLAAVFTVHVQWPLSQDWGAEAVRPENN